MVKEKSVEPLGIDVQSRPGKLSTPRLKYHIEARHHVAQLTLKDFNAIIKVDLHAIGR
jgi:hypothetical protein